MEMSAVEKGMELMGGGGRQGSLQSTRRRSWREQEAAGLSGSRPHPHEPKSEGVRKLKVNGLQWLVWLWRTDRPWLSWRV